MYVVSVVFIFTDCSPIPCEYKLCHTQTLACHTGTLALFAEVVTKTSLTEVKFRCSQMKFFELRRALRAVLPPGWTQLCCVVGCFIHPNRWTMKALFKVFFNHSWKRIQPFIKLLFPSCFMLLFHVFFFLIYSRVLFVVSPVLSARHCRHVCHERVCFRGSYSIACTVLRFRCILCLHIHCDGPSTY